MKKVKLKAKEMTGAIKTAFLMWIGAEHYPTIDSFCGEAYRDGLSKRVPHLGMAESLLSEGSTIFVAHDEGVHDDCSHCRGEFECPTCNATGEVKDGKGKKAVVRLCPDCNGRKRVELSSGGTIRVDGKVTPYRRFLALRKAGRLDLDEHEVEDKELCDACSGTGRVPVGKVFGVFIPDQAEYILTGADKEELLKKLEEKKVKTVTREALRVERRRGCGYRKPGGYYIVTRKAEQGEQTSDDVEAVIKELTDKGIINPEGVQVMGSFVRFLNPIPIPGTKRFRGVKKWGLDPLAEAEAELALEALA
jgi:hypothetical protein